MFMSSTASSALRPRQGITALCAAVPSNEYSTDTSPVPSMWPHAVPKRAPTCVNSTASTPSNRPSRTNHALAASSSSATPGQTTIVPGNRSRCMISFTASAATMLTA